MSDRTLCDSTKTSKTLAKLSELAYGLFGFIFQETDDYGRLDTDPLLIKAQRFPLITWITSEMVEHCIQEYQRVGMLFLWQEIDHRYGYFVGFEGKSGRYLSKRRSSQIPKPPPKELAKFLKDNNHFQTVPTVPNCSYKLSQVKLSQVKKDKNLLTPSAGFSDQQTVEKFISKETTFGSGGKQKDLEFRNEVKKVCLVYVARLQEWGEEIDDENKAVNKVFGLMMSLICYGVPKKPKKIRNFHGHFTEPQKAIQLINRMSKPKNPVAELVDAFKKQPQYLA